MKHTTNTETRCIDTEGKLISCFYTHERFFDKYEIKPKKEPDHDERNETNNSSILQ